MIRFRVEDESGAMREWEVSYPEFVRLISTGEADPNLEVNSDNLTQGQWKRLGEMTLYKKAMAVRELGSPLSSRDSVERTHAPGSSPDSKGGNVWTCGSCGRPNTDYTEKCWYCNTPKSGGLTSIAERPGTPSSLSVSDSVPSRYEVLRTVAVVVKFLAWLTAIVCCIAGIVTIVALQNIGGGGLGILGALAYFVAGAIGFVSLYATAEFIIVIIDIEENTRATRSLTLRTLQAIERLASRPDEQKD